MQTQPELNRIFLFNYLPVRRIIDTYMSMRLLESPAGLIARNIKNELSSIFQNAWIPANGSIYYTMHEAEEEGRLRSVWESSEPDLKDTRPYFITDYGIQSFRHKISESIELFDQGIRCLDIAKTILYSNASSEHARVSATKSQPLITPVFVELMIFAFAEKKTTFTTKELKDWLNDTFRDTYSFADTQIINRLNFLATHQFLSAEELPSTDQHTPNKNRGRKLFTITTKGYAHFQQLRSPEAGYYSRMNAIEKALTSIRSDLAAHQLYQTVKRFPKLKAVK